MGATWVSRPGLATDSAHTLRRDRREVRPKPIHDSATRSVTQAGTAISVSVVIFGLAGIVLAISAAAGLPIPQRAPWVTAIYVLNSLIALLVYAFDKRAATNHQYRVPEKDPSPGRVPGRLARRARRTAGVSPQEPQSRVSDLDGLDCVGSCRLLDLDEPALRRGSLGRSYDEATWPTPGFQSTQDGQFNGRRTPRWMRDVHCCSTLAGAVPPRINTPNSMLIESA